MPTYRARTTTVVEAVKMMKTAGSGEVFRDTPKWLVDAISKGVVRREGNVFVVLTMHGPSTAKAGDYIVREPDGEHVYPCDGKVFETRYEIDP